MKHKHIPESRPINFVLQVKMTRTAIPYEYGYTTEQEALDSEAHWCNIDLQGRLRWTDVKERHEFTWRTDLLPMP